MCAATATLRHPSLLLLEIGVQSSVIYRLGRLSVGGRYASRTFYNTFGLNLRADQAYLLWSTVQPAEKLSHCVVLEQVVCQPLNWVFRPFLSTARHRIDALARLLLKPVNRPCKLISHAKPFLSYRIHPGEKRRDNVPGSAFWPRTNKKWA